jgi:hypothetical protein
MTSCPLPRAPQTADIPHPQLGDMQRQQLTIDLDGCNVFIITQAMNEFDRKKTFGMRFESWPQEIRTIFDAEIEAWEKRNPGRLIKAYTISVAEQAFSLALHWKLK